ncbi:YqjF family protein [Deinococcus navajonensis]|uniref:YqjF family protein n=1 Tax=Deinococcus navajonensis TaxID=309884 RepID=A0ABV8XQH9_9DEIO
MKPPWILRLAWRDLLFLHWPLPAEALTPHLPDGVTLDTRDGQAWLALVAFNVTGFGVRGVPLQLQFPQINLRTYVRVQDVPGIWTFSLDAAHPLAVVGARWAYQLPYKLAEASLSVEDNWLVFQSSRHNQPDMDSHIRFRPAGPVFRALPGSTEHWLTERRSLYTLGWGQRLWRADVQHEAWPLQVAELARFHSGLPAQVGAVALGAPLAHFARVVHVKGWPPVGQPRDRT